MGYVKIILVGIIWILTLITSLKGWYKIVCLLLAIILPPYRIWAKDYLNAIFLSDDQDIYTLIGGKNADVTISDRVGRECIKLEQQGIFKSEWHQAEKVINTVFFWQPNHCRISIESDEEGV